ncbi:MAG: VWA domain-containing protein [Rhodothermales bacterium]
MPYTAEISRHHPGCLFFLIDQSTSMNLPFGGDGEASRAQQLTEAINRLLQELVVRCTKSQEEGVRPYFDVGVFGYGSESFGPVLGGTLTGRALVSVREVAEHPLRLATTVKTVPDGVGGVIEARIRTPLWFELDAVGQTPMCEALRNARTILEPWVREHPASFPPLVFNITDGEATDGDPRGPAAALRQLGTDDGHALLFNVHLSSSRKVPELYPSAPHDLPDDFARQLFEMSSVLPAVMQERFRDEGYAVRMQSRAFVFNADIGEVIRCLDIGTRFKFRR